MLKTLCTLALAMGLTSSVFAKDLEARTRSQKDSLSGAALDRTQGTLRRTNHKTRVSLEEMKTRLQRLGVMGHAASNIGWTDDDDAQVRRRSLRRVIKDAAGNGSKFREFGFYRGRTPAISDEALVAKASNVANEVIAAEGLAGVGEQLVPEQTVVLRYAGGREDGKEKDAFVVSGSVMLRRYVGGVPVLGPDAVVMVELDAVDGSLIEINIPMTRLEVEAPTAAAVAATAKSTVPRGRARVERLLAKAGAPVPERVGQKIQVQGEERVVKDLRCGYVEVDEGPLQPGCEILTTGSSGADAKSIKAD